MDEITESQYANVHRLTCLMQTMQWVASGKWVRPYAEYLNEMFGELLTVFGYESLEEIEDAVDDDALVIQLAAMEEFLASTELGGRNPIDEILRGPAKSYDQEMKAYLRALRGSILSAYEIVETGEILKIKDVIRGEGLTVAEIELDDLEVGDILIGRHITLNGVDTLSLGVLAYPIHGADELIEEIRGRIREATAHLGAKDVVKRMTVTDVVLGECAKLFLVDWLDFVLTLSEEEPKAEDGNGQRWYFPIFGSPDEVVDLLNGSSRLRADSEASQWRFLPGRPGAGPIEADEESDVQGLIRLDDGSLTMETESYLQARCLECFLYGLLGDRVGEPLHGLTETDDDEDLILAELEDEERS